MSLIEIPGPTKLFGVLLEGMAAARIVTVLSYR